MSLTFSIKPITHVSSVVYTAYKTHMANKGSEMGGRFSGKNVSDGGARRV